MRNMFMRSGCAKVLCALLIAVSCLSGMPEYAGGAALKGRWIASGDKRYHLDKDGVLATGLKKIEGKWYFFDSKGVMRTGTFKSGDTTYFLNDSGMLEASKKVRDKKTTYYHCDGKKMTSLEARDYATLLTARSIAAEITNSGMTEDQKLKACFDWVMKKNYRTWRKFENTPDWPIVHANDHFLNGCGDCHADGAALAYLASAIGCDDVYVCNDSEGEGHSWAEIGGLAYDPLFAQAKDYDKYYGAGYKAYVLHPILHVAVPCTSAVAEDVAQASGKPAWESESGKDDASHVAGPVLLKVKGGYSCYSDGRKVKNRWITAGAGRYYFDKKGLALTGIHVVDGQFYAFNSKGALNAAKTKKLQKAASYEKEIDALERLLGEPLERNYYGGSCYLYEGEPGEDGEWAYPDYTVGTFRTDSGMEIFMWAEGE